MLSVPPIGPSEGSYAAKNTLTQDYNTGIAALCAATPGSYTFINDSANTRDAVQLELVNTNVYTPGSPIL